MRSQREPVQGTAKLWLTIKLEGKGNANLYAAVFLHPHADVADPAWRLTRTNGASYDVALTKHGPTCTCPDYVFCRERRDEKGCKHIAALRSVGLLEERK